MVWARQRLLIELLGRKAFTMEHPLNTAALAVSQCLTLELIDATGAATPLEAELHYDAGDPYAVTIVFLTAQSKVRWTFSRDLLASGLYEPAGDGDVHVWPCLDAAGHAVVIIELCSPNGEAMIQARTGDVSSFVERTLRLVEPGTESTYLDMDAALAAILRAEGV